MSGLVQQHVITSFITITPESYRMPDRAVIRRHLDSRTQGWRVEQNPRRFRSFGGHDVGYIVVVIVDGAGGEQAQRRADVLSVSIRVALDIAIGSRPLGHHLPVTVQRYFEPEPSVRFNSIPVLCITGDN